MKNPSIYKKAAILLVAAVALVVPLAAQAAGTDRNVTITNKAVVNYTVGGVNQPLIESSPGGNTTAGAGNGTATTFVVDDKVMITVTDNNAGLVPTAPGASGLNAMKFTITNAGNGAHDIAVTFAKISDTMTGGATAALYEDTNGNGTFEPGTDQPAGAGATYLKLSGATAYIDEMPATGATSSRVVFLVVTTPAAATNGQTANFSITATAYNDLTEVRAGGTAGSLGTITAANTADANSASLLDIVLADAAGDGGDAANDGKYSKNGGFGFTVTSVTLSVQKTSAVISDPISASNPKAIPGAIMEYTIRVTYNGGSGTATSIELSDAVPANTDAVENQYGATGEVQRLTHDATGPVDTTTNLDKTADVASLTNWGTAPASSIKTLCGMTFNEVGDYCQIKYRVQIR